MLNFPEPPKSYSSVFLEETDKSLPEKIDPRTRMLFSAPSLKGANPSSNPVRTCIYPVFCYKTLKPEFAADEIEQKRLIREAR